MGEMHQRLCSDTFEDFHTRPLSNKQYCTTDIIQLLATDYGFSSHYKAFGAFPPSVFTTKIISHQINKKYSARSGCRPRSLRYTSTVSRIQHHRTVCGMMPSSDIAFLSPE